MATFELPDYSKHTIRTPSGADVVACFVPRAGGDTTEAPVMILLHGYPQSIHMWRHMIPLLAPHFSLFIPGIPGYGLSSLPEPSTKNDIARTILEAYTQHLPDRQRIILCGHDRGARIAHLISVSPSTLLTRLNLTLHALVLLDIIPTAVGYSAFSDPAKAASMFHWPFLANVDIAMRLITSMQDDAALTDPHTHSDASTDASRSGGGAWCRYLHTRWRGTNTTGLLKLASDNALDLYATQQAKRDVIRATCEDYAGAHVEITQQNDDQAAGRKINVPTLVFFSEKFLGRGFDVSAVWKEWVADASLLKVVGLGDGIGHFVAEEAPDVIGGEMLAFLAEVK